MTARFWSARQLTMSVRRIDRKALISRTIYRNADGGSR